MTKNLLAPSVGFLENMDKETERWFMHEVCGSQHTSNKTASKSVLLSKRLGFRNVSDSYFDFFQEILATLL